MGVCIYDIWLEHLSVRLLSFDINIKNNNLKLLSLQLLFIIVIYYGMLLNATKDMRICMVIGLRILLLYV